MIDRHQTTLRDNAASQNRWHDARVRALQLQRLVDWQLHPERYGRNQRRAIPTDWQLHGEQLVALRRRDPAADARLEWGKVQNLRLAAPGLDGLVLQPGVPISFWRAVGRASEAEGYVLGMELRGGCIRPAIGGGICLLSNALFALAASLGWQIAERHGHSVQAVPTLPGQLWGLDATVFWPYIDLRVVPNASGVLRCRVLDGPGGERLVLQVLGPQPAPVRTRLWNEGLEVARDGDARVQSAVLWREVRDATTGAVVACGPLAHNKKLLRHDDELQRNCLTCGEVSCHARVVPSAALQTRWRDAGLDPAAPRSPT